MEGYPESVKFLHKNTGWNHNAPILSDILYVKEEYRTAVENVLEPYLKYSRLGTTYPSNEKIYYSKRLFYYFP